MSTTPVFPGRVLPGGLLVLDRPKDYARYVRSFHGRFVEIIVRKQRTKRSLDQNALIHVIASGLADHCGNSLGEMKLYLMGECWGWQTVRGHEMPVKPHTSDMTVEEATQFIDWLFGWMVQNFPEFQLPPRDQRAA